MKNKFKITKIIASIFSLAFLILPVCVFAQIDNPLKFKSVTTLVNGVLNYVIKIGGVVATLAFIWAGFVYVKAQGKPAELDKAKTIFINTCIGAAILLGAQLISTIISGTINSLK
jgi:hypothetical protein